MPAEDLIRRHTALSAHIVAFCRFLRQEGFALGPAEQGLALQALEKLGFSSDPDAFRLCLRAVLARSRAQQERFDVLFPKYFKELENAVDSRIKQEQQPRRRTQQAPSLQALKSWLYAKPAEETVELATYSGAEAFSEKDFSHFTEAELAEISMAIQQLARTFALKLSRRQERSYRPIKLDLRHTLRRNLRRGAELLELSHVQPKKQRRQLLLLCDVSKSMELYSHFLIQFSYAFQQAFQRVETFVFGTELQRITPLLRGADYADALQRLEGQAGSWSAGTRIGESLHTLIRHYAHLLRKHTVVIIVSDGMDTGAPELLEENMRVLHRRAGRILWLNPLAGRPGYAPSTRGMEAALPFVDVFAPAHNLESLRALGKALANTSFHTSKGQKS